jgi:hypothetical protein
MGAAEARTQAADSYSGDDLLRAFEVAMSLRCGEVAGLFHGSLSRSFSRAAGIADANELAARIQGDGLSSAAAGKLL